MSRHIVELEPGDTLECKGPIPKLPYKANMKKSLGMVGFPSQEENHGNPRSSGRRMLLTCQFAWDR